MSDEQLHRLKSRANQIAGKVAGGELWRHQRAVKDKAKGKSSTSCRWCCRQLQWLAGHPVSRQVGEPAAPPAAPGSPASPPPAVPPDRQDPGCRQSVTRWYPIRFLWKHHLRWCNRLMFDAGGSYDF